MKTAYLDHKAHKSMRPIISGMGPPTYNKAKWLTKETGNLAYEKGFDKKIGC